MTERGRPRARRAGRGPRPRIGSRQAREKTPRVTARAVASHHRPPRGPPNLSPGRRRRSSPPAGRRHARACAGRAQVRECFGADRRQSAVVSGGRGPHCLPRRRSEAPAPAPRSGLTCRFRSSDQERDWCGELRASSARTAGSSKRKSLSSTSGGRVQRGCRAPVRRAGDPVAPSQRSACHPGENPCLIRRPSALDGLRGRSRCARLVENEQRGVLARVPFVARRRNSRGADIAAIADGVTASLGAVAPARVRGSVGCWRRSA